jgi:hypothetical protein
MPFGKNQGTGELQEEKGRCCMVEFTIFGGLYFSIIHLVNLPHMVNPILLYAGVFQSDTIA